MDEVHCIAIRAAALVKEAVREANERKRLVSSKRLVNNGALMGLVANLIVSVWNALCLTPHFTTTVTSDSFRPFCAGVLYSLKRGVRVPASNLLIVPCIPELCVHLPSLRSSNVTTVARQLQGSSHRGVCSIHRGLASIALLRSEQERAAVESKMQVANGIASRLQQCVQEAVARAADPAADPAAACISSEC